MHLNWQNVIKSKYIVLLRYMKDIIEIINILKEVENILKQKEITL